jgi:hypothetical protein
MKPCLVLDWHYADPILLFILHGQNLLTSQHRQKLTLLANQELIHASALHLYSEFPQDQKSSDLTLRSCGVIIKCRAANSLIFKNLIGK